MAGGKITEKERKEYTKIFKEYDNNGDGRITVKELGIACRAVGYNPTNKELKAMVSEADLDESGTIELAEFLPMMAQQKAGHSEENLREAFQYFDKDGTGLISATELKHVLTSVGERLTDREVETFFKDGDKNDDGYINYEEFVPMMLQL